MEHLPEKPLMEQNMPSWWRKSLNEHPLIREEQNVASWWRILSDSSIESNIHPCLKLSMFDAVVSKKRFPASCCLRHIPCTFLCTLLLSG